MDNSDYTFEVSLTTKAFDHKPNKLTEVPKLRFETTTTDIGSFAAAIADGYCYAPVFNSTTFGMHDKTDGNFAYSCFVSIDIDHSKVEMTTMIEGLTYKPTLAYTSCSCMEEDYCYRLIYCFFEKIEGIEEYTNLVHAILEANQLPISIIDRRSFKASQYYNGNGCGSIDMNIPGIIYNKYIFNNFYKFYNTGAGTSKSATENYNNSPNIMHLDCTFANENFAKDFMQLSLNELISKYVDIFDNLEHTPLPEVDDDTPYIVFPDDYVEIKRYWRKEDGRTAKIKDGEGRRYKLFINGILRRLINPSITFDNLVYNLVYELVYYITNYNADNIITKKDIIQIAMNVMNADMSNYESLKGSKRKFIVNKAFCIKYGLKANAVKNMAAGAIRAEQIGNLYDCSLTDKVNLEIMKEHGLSISLRTLKNWRKENNITKNKTCKNN